MFVSLLGILALLLAALHLLVERYKGRKLPGPMGLPVFGYYFFLGKNPMWKLHELSKKYGNIFGLYIGSHYYVVVDDWLAAKGTVSKTELLDRNVGRFAQVPYKFGIAGINGQEWLQNRIVTSKALKEVVTNRVGWEDLLQKETQDWIHRIARENGKPVDLNEFFAHRFVDIMMPLIFGEQPRSSSKQFAKAVNTISERIPAFQLGNLSPTLGAILKLLAIEDLTIEPESVEGFAKYVSEVGDSKAQDPVKSVENHSFIDQVQVEVENQRKDMKSFITADSLKGDALTLLVAGVETTRSVLVWALIAMAENQDQQRKVHEELDSVIGKEGGVHKWGEQSRVPYTYAALLESMRWRTPVPFIIRRSTEDMEINGYRVSKGTTFAFNFWAMHNDPRFWRDPEQFEPERFLLEEGQKVDSAPESYGPFSFGKRNCVGKLIGLQATFLIFATLMQKFKVLPASAGGKVQYETNLGLIYQARNVQLRFIPR